MRRRDVVLVAFPGLQGLDLIGPAEVFAAATEHTGRAAYRVRVVASTAGLAPSSSGVGIVADEAIADVAAPIDTLMVVGGDGTYGAVADEHLVHHVRRLAEGARRVTSVCSGAFVLAQAGLLDGKRATTHWRVCDLLARTFPAVDVDPDPIFVRDGRVWTSAGVTAGMDLALALVEEDHGADVALAIARRLCCSSAGRRTRASSARPSRRRPPSTTASGPRSTSSPSTRTRTAPSHPWRASR